jgi:hypothetical protein
VYKSTEGIAEHYIRPTIPLTGVILDPSLGLRIRSSLQRTSEQYIGISIPLAAITLTPAPLAGYKIPA